MERRSSYTGAIAGFLSDHCLNRRSADLVAGRTDATVLDFASYPGGKGVPDDYIGWMDSLVQALAKTFVAKTK